LQKKFEKFDEIWYWAAFTEVRCGSLSPKQPLLHMNLSSKFCPFFSKMMAKDEKQR
jgi:hypothetical protein